jgi:very-short-patch-repair endonuclease
VLAARNVYAAGPEPVSLLDRSVAGAIASGGCVNGTAAAALHGGLDLECVTRVSFTIPTAQSNKRTGASRTPLVGNVIVVDGVRVTDGLQTLVDLAAELDDRYWEHALEAALRKQLTTVEALEAVLPTLSARRQKGTARIRRVLALRPTGGPPTESLLETYAVQMIRDAGLPEPTRQYRVFTVDGRFVARVDLCWPELGVFLELDGRGHDGQPVYDAVRQTAVVMATRWLPVRATWRQVVYNPRATARDLAAVLSGGRP